MNTNEIIVQEIFQGYKTDLSCDEKEALLSASKEEYLSILDAMISNESHKNIFSGYNSPLKIHMIVGKSNYNYNIDIFYFSEISQEKDELVFHYLLEETNSFDYAQSADSKFKLGWLIDKGLIDVDLNNIIKYSLTIEHFIVPWTQRWIEQEFNQSQNHFSKTSFEMFDFNSFYLRPDYARYSTLLKTINSEQLTMEFSECLFAYENEKWFICASGLGAILEEVMFLTLEKTNELHLLGKGEPTASIYRSAFRKSRILQMDGKTDAYIKHIFGLRNSVNHFKTGFSNKEMVDEMLKAIEKVYREYYLPNLI